MLTPQSTVLQMRSSAKHQDDNFGEGIENGKLLKQQVFNGKDWLQTYISIVELETSSTCTLRTKPLCGL